MCTQRFHTQNTLLIMFVGYSSLIHKYVGHSSLYPIYEAACSTWNTLLQYICGVWLTHTFICGIWLTIKSIPHMKQRGARVIHIWDMAHSYAHSYVGYGALVRVTWHVRMRHVLHTNATSIDSLRICEWVTPHIWTMPRTTANPATKYHRYVHHIHMRAVPHAYAWHDVLIYRAPANVWVSLINCNICICHL